MIPLPIDPLLPEIVAALAARRAIVIEAPPGAGKTTRVPRALLWAVATPARGDAISPKGDRPGEIIVLQPRRLPARLGAARGAEGLGERGWRRSAASVWARRSGTPSASKRSEAPVRACASSPRGSSRDGCSPIPS